MKSADVVFELIKKEENRQISGIELIASENFTSPAVMEATGSILTNKYAEGYPGKRYYGGCEVIDEIEQIAIDRAKLLFGAEYANVQPHSGSQANTAVFHAFLQPGDIIFGFDLAHGGHLTHGSPVNFSGRLYNAHFYGVEKDTGTLNYDKISTQAKKINPKKNCVIGFGITEKTISKLKSADGLVVGSAICKEITRSLKKRQNPVTNVFKLVNKLKNKIL